MKSMFEAVKEEYYLINGNADKLMLRLYTSENGIKTGDCRGESVYIIFLFVNNCILDTYNVEMLCISIKHINYFVFRYF